MRKNFVKGISVLLLSFSVFLLSCGVTEIPVETEKETEEQSLDERDYEGNDSSEDPIISYMSSFYQPSDYLKNHEKESVRKIRLSDDTTRIQGSGCALEGNTITIQRGGVYLISGSLSDGQIVVDIDKSEKAFLFFDNVSVSCSYSAPLYVVNGDKVVLSLLENTVNTFTDKVTTEGRDGDILSSCIFSKEDLTINGPGKLVVYANARDGISSKDSIKILGAEIEVNALCDGIYGKDEIIVYTNSLSVRTGNGAEVTKVNTHGGKNVDFFGFSTEKEENADSKKGLKSEGDIRIFHGDIFIDSEDDGIHAAGDIEILQGNVTVSSSDDAIHSDKFVTVSGGSISVPVSYEGIEAPEIVINDGIISVYAEDDGFSACGKDGKGAKIEIHGGVVTVDAKGDGIDSNDSFIMDGGEVMVFGPSENFDGYFDVERDFLINGGKLIGAGSSGMLSLPSKESESYFFTVTGLYAVEGDEVEVKNGKDETIFSFTALRKLTAITASTEEMQDEEVISIFINGEFIKETIATKDIRALNGWGIRPDRKDETFEEEEEMNPPEKPDEMDNPPEKSEDEKPGVPPQKPQGGQPPQGPQGGQPPQGPQQCH